MSRRAGQFQLPRQPREPSLLGYWLGLGELEHMPALINARRSDLLLFS
jgi:hypothetical protein